MNTKKFLEVSHLGAMEGVIAVGDDGFATVHEEWLKSLIIRSGGLYQEVFRK